jgi:hypothetical protein
MTWMAPTTMSHRGGDTTSAHPDLQAGAGTGRSGARRVLVDRVRRRRQCELRVPLLLLCRTEQRRVLLQPKHLRVPYDRAIPRDLVMPTRWAAAINPASFAAGRTSSWIISSHSAISPCEVFQGRECRHSASLGSVYCARVTPPHALNGVKRDGEPSSTWAAHPH